MGNCVEDVQQYCLGESENHIAKQPETQPPTSRRNYHTPLFHSKVGSQAPGFTAAEPALPLASGLPQFKFPQQYDDLKTRAVRSAKLQGGVRYEGQWENDKPEGKGMFYFPKKWRYIGYVQGGRPQKYGRYTNYENGTIYEGGITNALFSGKGVLYAGESKFEGKFEAGEKVFGVETRADGTRYEGEYLLGARHGHGELLWPDGMFYKGSFKDGAIEGEGEILYPGGRRYKGGFVAEKKNGFGRFDWQDGSYYEGGYFNNYKHGAGVFVWKDGRRYEGQFQYGKQHGHGVLVENGVRRQVQYCHGVLVQDV